jgi:hypothetical protein
MLRGFVLFGDDFTEVRLVAAVHLHGIPAPHWQPSSASQARSGWFSQTHLEHARRPTTPRFAASKPGSFGAGWTLQSTTPPERNMIARRRRSFLGQALKSPARLCLHTPCQGSPGWQKSRHRGRAGDGFRLARGPSPKEKITPRCWRLRVN